MMTYYIFSDFEPTRIALNNLHHIPKNGYKNGVELKDGTGQTINYVLAGTSGYVKKLDKFSQETINILTNNCDEIIEDYETMVSRGFINEEE